MAPQPRRQEYGDLSCKSGIDRPNAKYDVHVNIYLLRLILNFQNTMKYRHKSLCVQRSELVNKLENDER